MGIMNDSLARYIDQFQLSCIPHHQQTTLHGSAW